MVANIEQYDDSIHKLGSELMNMPQVDCPLTHLFAPGVYYREIFMPANTCVVGHKHKTEHLNIVLSGKALVIIDGEKHKIEAPTVFVSKPGVSKVLLIIEDMRYATIHPTDETDIENSLWKKHEEVHRRLLFLPEQ